MTPPARAMAAMEVLAAWAAGREGVDRQLVRWGRSHRFAGSGDRHAIADRVYAVLRRARSLQWLAGSGDPGSDLAALDPRAAVLAAAAMAGEDPDALADGSRHGPSRLTAVEAAALADLPGAAASRLAGAPAGVRRDLPDWLAEGADAVPGGAVLGERAPLDLRVNTLRTDRAGASEALADAGIATVPGPLAPTCLRVVSGGRQVTGSGAYRDGLVEIQDAASQAAAAFAGAEPGQVVLDLCAGGGGKALALGAAMRDGGRVRGRLIAHDADPARMADIPARAARAGISVDRVDAAGLDRLAGRVDLVFADAPCSGSGAWRRNPDARWRFAPADLARLTALQDRIIDRARALVAPGGTIVFATCSCLAAEGPARVLAWARRAGDDAITAAPRFVTLPEPESGDGFFAVKVRAAF